MLLSKYVPQTVMDARAVWAAAIFCRGNFRSILTFLPRPA